MTSRDKIKSVLWQAFDRLRDSYNLSESIECVSKMLLIIRLSGGSDTREAKLDPRDEKFSQLDLPTELHRLAQNLQDRQTVSANFWTRFFWARFDNETLQHLIRLFSTLDLSAETISDEELGEAYTEFLEKATSIHSREAYTPKQLTRLLVELINPDPLESIYDPACGLGEFLAECINFTRDLGGSPLDRNIQGQDANLQKCEIAKANLLLHGMKDPDIRLGSAVTNPCFIENGELSQFNVVLANPPFNVKYLPQQLEQLNPLQFPHGIPLSGIGNFLFIQHVLSSLTATGRAAIILPRGVLFNRSDESIRTSIINDDVIEAVIELAPKLFCYVSIPVIVMVFNRSKVNKGKILFIDASLEYKAERKQNRLEPEHIEHITSTYHNFRDEEEFARLVSLSEVKTNHYDLSIDRYVLRSSPSEKVNVADEVRRLQQLEANYNLLLQQNNEHLKALGLEL